MIKTLSFILLLAMVGVSLAGQEIIYESYAGKVDFWVLVPYNTFNFKKGQDVAEYQIALNIRNGKKKQLASFGQNVKMLKRDWLEDSAIPFHFTQDLPPGAYSADLKIRNMDLGEKRNLKKSFEIGKESTEIGLSWILAQREGIRFIPNNLATLKEEIEQVILRQSFSLDLDSLRINIDKQQLMVTLPQSPIELDLKPYLPSTAQNTLKLTMYEKNVHYALEPFFFSPWYSYSLRYSIADQLAQLRYIATQNEWQVLRQIPADKQAQAIESYWKANDSSPGTVRNETREKFYQRVLRADEQFTIHKKLQGWNSDRGRIYIKYGEPDEINTEVHPIGRYPNITWTYYKQNKEFYFADLKGYGQYLLRNKDDEY
ncbi:MAG: GWxTD domain-containing protein [Candidatus Cloacimonas sp.]|jgi:GWxTD domain-containing protein|nr:GWxTD domain-containing protein [Candidatus Cloacimonas sp.]